MASSTTVTPNSRKSAGRMPEHPTVGRGPRRRRVGQKRDGSAVIDWLTHYREVDMSSSLTRKYVPLVLAALVLIAGSALTADAQKKGGILKVGNLGEPPSLDAHWTTASITETLTNHIYEGLYSLDSSNRPIPMLAESHTVSKDGLVYTFKLRQGVKFHNGKEMTSDDVVASLARWGKQSVYRK